MKPEFYHTKQDSPSYAWAVVVMAGIAGAMFGIILWLRPNADPLAVAGIVTTMTLPTITGVLSYMKAQETHRNVNSRLDAWIEASGKLARAEGEKKGAADEVMRRKEEDERR